MALGDLLVSDRGTQDLVHRVDGNWRAHHADGGGQEAVPRARRVLPSDHHAGCRPGVGIQRSAAGGYVNAGQVCIPVNVIAHLAVSGDFLDALVPKVEAIRLGDLLARDRHGDPTTTGEAERVRQSIAAAAAGGARVLTGGERDGSMVSPTVVADVDPRHRSLRMSCLGLPCAVSTAEDWESAVRQANGTAYGLPRESLPDVAGAVRAMRQIDAGSIHINWTPLWRADLMPYGGLKGSGIGKEGPRWAVEEMTELKTVILHGRPW